MPPPAPAPTDRDYREAVVRIPQHLPDSVGGQGPSTVDCATCNLLMLPHDPATPLNAWEAWRDEESGRSAYAAACEEAIVERPDEPMRLPRASIWLCHPCQRRVVLWWAAPRSE